MHRWNVSLVLLLNLDLNVLLELVMGVDTFMLLRTVTSPETLNGQDQSDESWT
jgi:hypothetical protein